jgi:MFS family permease
VELPVARQFHVSKEVAILGVSLFVLGLGLGPLVAGPMSEIYGRNIVYRVSFSLFFICTFPVAFAPHICMYAFCLGSSGIMRYMPTAVYLTFRFICGYCGSAFLSVAGGSVSDMFSNSEVATWVMTVVVFVRLMNHRHDLCVGRWRSIQYARLWGPS